MKDILAAISVMLTAIFAPVVEQLTRIANALEGAKVSQTPAAEPKTDKKKKATDDDGLGLDIPKAPAPPKHTFESVKALAMSVKEDKGRVHVKNAMTAVGADTMDEVKEEHFDKFVALLNA